MTIEIELPLKLTQQLLHQAQQYSDLEICGLVSIQNQQFYRCYPIENIADFPQKQFLLNPQQQIHAIKQMRENGETLFAIYHSHPQSPAIPSATDIAWAEFANIFHLIISLNIKGLLEIRGFKIEHQQVEELILRLIP
ncbi:MAG: hypothetical protein RL637_631 [Pseudomonadota bacterium]|jgi:proteasome lid subunit RPN8/RPN11